MALSPILQELLGQQAEAAQAAPATPTPNISNFIAGLMAPQDTTPSPLMKASERKESLSNKKTTVTPKRPAPLKKKEEAPAAVAKEEIIPSISDIAAKDTTDRAKDVYKRLGELRQDAKPGQTVSEKLFANLVPKKTDFDKALSQALDMEAAAIPEYQQSMEDNKYTQGIAKTLLQEKMANPYRGVNLERMDKLSAALMGAKPLGMQNEPSPQEELTSLAAMNKLKQAYEQFKAKEVGDYATRILTPYNVGGAGFTVPQPSQPRAEAKPKEVRAIEIDKYTNEIQMARDLYAKGNEILAVLDEAKNVPITDVMAHYKLKQKYDRLVNEVRTSNKEARGFGAAFSALENKLNSASLPGAYMKAVAERKLNAGSRVDNLTSFINQANALAEEKSKASYSAYTRPGEKEHLDIRTRGYQAEAAAGSGAKTVPSDIQALFDKAAKGVKK